MKYIIMIQTINYAQQSQNKDFIDMLNNKKWEQINNYIIEII